MRAITLAAAATLVLHSLSCGGLPRAATTQAVNMDANTNQGLSPETSASLKSLLFSDEPLEKLLARTDPNGPGAKEDPWRSFALVVAHSKEGKADEAKRDLRRVLALPDAETRILLSAWTALRAMGERPKADEADAVQGVVFELHNEAGIGTVAAYRDGRARLFGGQGAATFWDAPHSDKEIDALIEKFLKEAEPFVKRSPAAEGHKAVDVARDYIRVTVLTFGGLHVTDVYGPSIDEKHSAAHILMASVYLLDALTKRTKEQEGKPAK